MTDEERERLVQQALSVPAPVALTGDQEPPLEDEPDGAFRRFIRGGEA